MPLFQHPHAVFVLVELFACVSKVLRTDGASLWLLDDAGPVVQLSAYLAVTSPAPDGSAHHSPVLADRLPCHWTVGSIRASFAVEIMRREFLNAALADE
jgi:hypothetical protein